MTCSLCTLLQRYFDAAEKDKERYMKEYSAYQQTESYKQFMKLKYTGIAEDEKISVMICLVVLHLRLELNHDLLTIVVFFCFEMVRKGYCSW